MRIVQLATEFAPLAKAGGLGEVVTGLSRELLRVGVDVEVILPKYDSIDTKKLHNLKMEATDFKCLNNSNTVFSAEWEKIPISLLDTHHPAQYFHRGQIYGCDDDIARFLYFSRAALEYLKLRGKTIDILHLHDWHVAIAAVLLRDLFHLPVRSILLTIHNAAYQGKCATWDLDAIGLKGAYYLEKEKLQDDDPTYPDNLNLLKGGIVYANAVNAVSPTYAKELLTSEYGYGLDLTFRKYQSKLTGILNGLDLSLWNPEKDHFLNERFSSASIFQAKEANRKALANCFNLEAVKRPWIGAITRLVPQKGPKLLEEALKKTLQLGGTFLLLGASPIPKMQAHFEALKEKYKGNQALLLHFEYDDALAHQIYAALDFLVIPSLYEPCGLSQMIAMRYGTVPIARATGGHKDTIFDCDNPFVQTKDYNGFLFPNANSLSMNKAIERAHYLFWHDPSKIELLIKNGRSINWSWEKPAQKYLELYKILT